MKTWQTCLALALMMFSWGGLLPVAAQQPITLRVHYYLPAAAPLAKDFVGQWAKKVESESNGRIKIETYPSMQLGGTPSQLLDQVKDGVADIVIALPGGTPGRFPKSETLELPFIAGNAEQSSRVAWDFYSKHLKDEFDGVHMIAAFTHSPGVIHVKGNGVKKLEDMKGLKLRGLSRIVNELLEALGATPVGMPMPSVPDSLAKGVIDGALIPWEVTIPLRVHEIVKNHTTFGGDRSLYVGFLVFAMNKQKYDSLPADLKAIIDKNSGPEVSRQAGRVLDEADARAIEVARKRGNNIVVLDPAEVDRWKQASQKVYQSWISRMKEKGIDGKALVDDVNSMFAKYVGAK